MLTATEEVAKDISQVTVYHPSGVLQGGMVIIDTPGANAQNTRHIEVTGRAVREISDAAIIVIPANVPVSQTLIHFLRNHLSDVIHRCIFIVSKMDLIHPRERTVLIKNIEARLKTGMGLDCLKIFSFSPIVIMDNLVENCDEKKYYSEEDEKNLLGEALKTEQEIQKVLQEQRLLMQLEKLTTLLCYLLNDLKEDMNGMEKSYFERHQALKNNTMIDMSSFINEQKGMHTKKIKNNTSHLFNDAMIIIEKVKDSALEELQDAVNSAPNEQELRKIMKEDVSTVMNKAQNEMQRQLREVYDKVGKVSRKQLADFERDFKVLYKTLSTLGGRISVDERKLEQEVSSFFLSNFNTHATEIKSLISSEESKEGWTIFGGAGAGAALGTVIFPGIGTVVGGIVGFIAGTLFGPSIGELRKRYWDKLEPAVEESFSLTQDAVENSLKNTISSSICELDKIIDHYFERYNKLIRKMIERDQAEAAELKRLCEVIHEDLDQLQKRQERLYGIKESLKAI